MKRLFILLSLFLFLMAFMFPPGAVLAQSNDELIINTMPSVSPAPATLLAAEPSLSNESIPAKSPASLTHNSEVVSVLKCPVVGFNEVTDDGFTGAGGIAPHPRFIT